MTHVSLPRTRGGAPLTKALCAIVAVLMVVSSLAIVGTNAEDTGRGEVSAFAGPPSLWSNDIAWNYNKTIAVSVGENSDSGDNAWWYSTVTNGWTPIGTGALSDIFYGVDYDEANDYFYLVGECAPAAWYWAVGNPAIFPLSVGPAASLDDVACYGDSVFVAVGNNASYNYDMGLWTEIKGALPCVGIALQSVFYDSGKYIIYMAGQGATGAALYYASAQDFGSGNFVAYDISPLSDYFLGGDWSAAAGTGLLVGPKNITKLTSSIVNSEWREIDTKNTAPAARRDSAWAWCPPTKTFILFGGACPGVTYMNDTWEYNPYNRSWRKLAPLTVPPNRARHQMVFDELSQNVIMFGGFVAGPGGYQDTWAFNLTTKDWTMRLASSPFSNRYQHKMVYGYVGAVSAMRPITYGGFITNGSATNTMYYYTYATNTWTNMSPVGTPPSVYQNGLAYDPVSNSMLLYGGLGQETATYRYISLSNTWAQLTPAQNPGGRRNLAMAYSSQYDGIIVYGGDMGANPLNTSYRWNRTSLNWEQILTPAAPSGLSSTCMAPDANGRLHIFAGQNLSTNFYTNKSYTLGRTMYVNSNVLYSNASRIWYDVDWYPDGSQAIAVGNGGNIMEYRPPGFIRAISNGVYPSNLYSVACKPPSSPGYAIALGFAGGVKVNQVFVTSNISVNAEVPHVASMDIYDSVGNPMTNSRINVDSGTGTSYYFVQAGLYFLGGCANFTRIDLYGWRDNGTGWDMPAALGGAFDAADYGNVRFHYQYNITSNNWFQYAPWHGAELESELWGAPQSYYSVINSTFSLVNFQFIPRKQFRYAPGPTIWNEIAGNRYNSAVLNGQETASALNDPSTWDFKLTVTTYDGLTASAYDEFGVFKYTYIGASDVPATISGSGPPGGTVYMSPEQNVSFVSNCNHTLKVYMDGLLRGMNDANRTMPASALGVMGGDLQNWTIPGTQAHFNGTLSANALYLFGANGSYVQPRTYYTTTHTGYGTIGTVRWRCIIPMGTAEDRYTTTVTFMLEHD